ncbi:hypothetical protein LMG33818_001837 [Halomonadaceae bacterium LMG 33818]
MLDFPIGMTSFMMIERVCYKGQMASCNNSQVNLVAACVFLVKAAQGLLREFPYKHR